MTKEGTAHVWSLGINADVTAARMMAEVSQAKPTAEVVSGSGWNNARKPRKARGHGGQMERSSLDR